jgi:hypothetical protein
MTDGPEMSSTAIMTLCNATERERFFFLAFARKEVVIQLHTHPSFPAADAARALVANNRVLRLD